ncbi:hypothetical protein EDB19DRAFT_2026900 [Suillus lakei]|nr:hypothetical protein EDB19DRAFT_2026900 [Suillus lakei]
MTCRLCLEANPSIIRRCEAHHLLAYEAQLRLDGLTTLGLVVGNFLLVAPLWSAFFLGGACAGCRISWTLLVGGWMVYKIQPSVALDDVNDARWIHYAPVNLEYLDFSQDLTTKKKLGTVLRCEYEHRKITIVKMRRSSAKSLKTSPMVKEVQGKRSSQQQFCLNSGGAGPIRHNPSAKSNLVYNTKRQLSRWYKKSYHLAQAMRFSFLTVIVALTASMVSAMTARLLDLVKSVMIPTREQGQFARGNILSGQVGRGYTMVNVTTGHMQGRGVIESKEQFSG